MSVEIGAKIPPPLRFELGIVAAPGDPIAALLFISADDDGKPRLAVLAPAEVRVLDDSRLRIELRSDSATRSNLRARPEAALWCVLDAAAYTIRGRCTAAGEVANDAANDAIELRVTSVLRDFQSDAPLIAGPKYRKTVH